MTMAYKALMVEAGPGAGTEARVRLAAKLAGECGAQLIGLAACAVRPPFMPPFGESVMVADIIEDDMRRVRAMLEAAGDRFRAIAGAAAEWRAFLEYPGDALAREARAAELVIIGRDAEARPAGVRQTAAPGDVLMRAGRPVLVVPPGVTGLAGRRVLVAWNESREARRAVIDALPLLARAERVQVLEICEPGEGAALGSGTCRTSRSCSCGMAPGPRARRWCGADAAPRQSCSARRSGWTPISSSPAAMAIRA
ncbi:hypothetical protein QWZ14_13370 [Paeniroseomonas aquatica]|uniref:UspA domain-containing protein n=1 Tax=Paeniroseomonas aquatica TaxID=373043 RepID=A0ABT8A6N4_9PROT|nr:hypothetical protein [Paeniroseomonas aquatica]MDN3565356.1 hypothetical protein [Paeniroseomonas aquatica]